MRLTLSARLVGIMLLSIFLSSLITVFLMSFMAVSRFRGYALQNERNTELTLAEALTRAAAEGRLEEAVNSLGMGPPRQARPLQKNMKPNSLQPRNRNPGMREGHGLPGGGHMVMEDNVLPIVICDNRGRILDGYHSREGEEFIPEKHFAQGAAFYRNNEVAGYVFVGYSEGAEGIIGQYSASIIRSILLSSLLSALMAALLGIPLLRKSLKSLKQLHRGVLQIKKGDYAFRMDSDERKIQDELSQLCEGFNEMAQAIESSEEWKKQIISDTAHELRTPVSLIMGNLEMILDGVYTPDRKRLESLYRQSGDLAQLIRDLQQLAHEESGRSTSEKRDFSLNDLVKECVDDFRPMAEKKNIRLEFAEYPSGLSFSGDKNKTEQALKNLVSNALKFTPPSGLVRVSSGREQGMMYIDIEDSGPGIPRELREKVFHRFFKLDSSRNSEGSGLGLAISRLLVQHQGGRLQALEAPGGGARFRILLPQAPSPASESKG